MVLDPYAEGLVTKSIFAKRSLVKGRLVAILDGAVKKRGLQLIIIPSRALRRGEIHELILTDEKEAVYGAEVNNINFVAFFEVVDPGIILAGDQVVLDGKKAGTLVGYDETHMPNHMNIVLFAEKMTTGLEMGVVLGDEIIFG